MANTIIENLNSLILTKSSLNSILRNCGVDGGDIFSTYPTKFQYVFDSIEDIVNNILGE